MIGGALVRRCPGVVMVLCGLVCVPVASAGIEVGACCVGGVCDDAGGLGIDRDTCELTLGGVFQGDGTNCQTAPCPPPVPAASTWGLVVMILSLSIGATVIFRAHEGVSRKCETKVRP